jgi:hypothetical protein
MTDPYTANDTASAEIYSVISDFFIRADANSDEHVQMADAIFVLKHLYVPGSDTLICKDTGDSDDDGTVRMSDALYTLRYLYVPGSPPPPVPFPGCGSDLTSDTLNCVAHPCMNSPRHTRPMKPMR